MDLGGGQGPAQVNLKLMRSIFRIGVAAVALGGALAYGQTGIQEQVDPVAVQQNPILKDVRVDQKPGAQVPLGAEFTDETGKVVTFGSLLHNRPLILVPIFFRCKGVCEVELEGVINALRKDQDVVPGQNVDVAVLSINPKEKQDLAEGKKQATLEEYGKPKTAGGWHFLTGDMPNIRSVTDSMGFQFTYDADQDRVNHPSGIMVITPGGKVSTYMLKGMYEPGALNRDVLLAAKSGVAPKSEDLYFGCVHVDPITGKRSLVIQGVMKVLGLATVAAILIGIVSLARKGRA
jgi:protein SCO1